MRTGVKIIGVMIVTAILLSSATVSSETWPPEKWTPGDEKAKLGHTFEEEYWTSDISNTSADGTKYTFTCSYVNKEHVQAFLVAFKTAEKNGTISTLPYQFFGMHYYTPLGTEVFLGSVLAFLMAYNDTFDGNGSGQNGVMDPGNEDVYYIIPFGIGDLPLFESDTSYVPQVEALPAKKLADNKYEFGMKYKNMYAKIIDGNTPLGFLLTAVYPLYIAKFSELTVRYVVTFDKENKKMTAETYYTLGQVNKLWFLGVPVEPSHLPSTFGISAVHFVVTFNSKYATADNAGKSLGKLTAGMTEKTEGVQMKVGTEERAFDIGFRGNYDLIDENQNNKVIQKDEKAMNLLLAPRAGDLILVAWQGAISAGLMSIFAYALSKQIQTDYDGPYDLAHNAANKFWINAAFWYAVTFPKWNGYRVEHDPTMTAYSSFAAPPEPDEPKKGCSSIIMLSVGIVGLAVYSGNKRIFGDLKRKKKE